MFYFWRLDCLRPQSPGRLLFYCLCWMSDKHFPPPAASGGPTRNHSWRCGSFLSPSPTHCTSSGITVPGALLADPTHLARLPHLTAKETETQRGDLLMLPSEPVVEPGHPYLSGTQPHRVSL